MKRLIVIPEGWQCTLKECPSGYFVCDNLLCFKLEYKTEKGEIEAYNEAGEFFWGGTESYVNRAEIIVQPVSPVWEEYEE